MSKWKHPRILREALGEYISLKLGLCTIESSLAFMVAEPDGLSQFMNRNRGTERTRRRIQAAINELQAKEN